MSKESRNWRIKINDLFYYVYSFFKELNVRSNFIELQLLFIFIYLFQKVISFKFYFYLLYILDIFILRLDNNYSIIYDY